ncbi:DUF2868 domain-containing protein [Aquincola tertiaricarbonis]|uniref:DUF2868 domain-containing protein n=1 Tax=Aquincola tertiaricarbonis TaxID=391953 RepID=A0ABY4S6A4_AQUTE|nr:DUF2868 domain-containing protein [Aquincola tertiaricarbonis]URI07436.1 DUF2868 domain-containing protein [Aquincola tertiaricarbonis]
MTEDEARRITLLRAFEAPLTPPWTEADAAAASAEAARTVGEAAAPARYLSTRANAGLQMLLPREPAAARLLRASRATRWPGLLLVAAAAALGLATPALGESQRLNLLAPPLLGLIGWNLLVYAVLAAMALARGLGRGRAAAPTATADNTGAAPTGAGWLHRLLAAPGWSRAAAAAGLAPAATDPPANALARTALSSFTRRWAALAAPLWSARAAAWLHAAAAALVVGVLASMYLRGLALEFRAGWDSTFLSPAAVHTLLQAWLGPASALSGIALPGVDELARLRFSQGPGENAARWIHLHALTAAGLVLLPRLLLAAAAGLRARRLAADFPLPLDDAYSLRLLRSHRGQPLPLRVQPFGYRAPAASVEGLERVLRHSFGEQAQPQWALPLQEADELAGPAPALLLFTLAATPERETHGAAAAAWPEARLLVDTAGFAQRFGADRTRQRREAWLKMLAGLGRTPVFIDLQQPDLAAAEADLQSTRAS